MHALAFQRLILIDSFWFLYINHRWSSACSPDLFDLVSARFRSSWQKYIPIGVNLLEMAYKMSSVYSTQHQGP